MSRPLCVGVSSPGRFPSATSPLLPGLGSGSGPLSAEQPPSQSSTQTKPIGPSVGRGVVGPPSTPSSLPTSASSSSSPEPQADEPYPSYSHPSDSASSPHVDYHHQHQLHHAHAPIEASDDVSLGNLSSSYEEPPLQSSYYQPSPLMNEGQLHSPPAHYDQGLGGYYDSQQGYGNDYSGMYGGAAGAVAAGGGYDQFGGMQGLAFNQRGGMQGQGQQQQQKGQQRGGQGALQTQRAQAPQGPYRAPQGQPQQGAGGQQQGGYGQQKQAGPGQDKQQQQQQQPQQQQAMQQQQPQQQQPGVGQQKKFNGPGPIAQQGQVQGPQAVRPGLNGSKPQSASPPPPLQQQQQGGPQSQPQQQPQQQQQRPQPLSGQPQQGGVPSYPDPYRGGGGYGGVKPSPYAAQPLAPYQQQQKPQPHSPQSFNKTGGYKGQQQGGYGKQQPPQPPYPSQPYPPMQPYNPYGYNVGFHGYNAVPAPYYPTQYQQGPPGFAQRGGYAGPSPYAGQYGSGYSSPNDYAPYEGGNEYSKYGGAGGAAGVGGFGGAAAPAPGPGGVGGGGMGGDNSVDGGAGYGVGNDWQGGGGGGLQQQQQQQGGGGGGGGGVGGGAKKTVGPESDPAAQRLGPFQSPYPLAQQPAPPVPHSQQGGHPQQPQSQYHAVGGFGHQGALAGVGGGAVGGGVPPPAAHAGGFSQHPQSAYDQQRPYQSWAPTM